MDGRVQIVARKGDLTISDEAGTTTLAQAQQTTRDDSPSQNNSKRRKKDVSPAAAAGAGGAIMDSPWTIGIAGGIVIGGTAWVLSKGDDPVSAAKPQ